MLISPEAATAEAAALLDRNLAALAKSDPGFAERLRRTAPRPDIQFVETSDDGALSALLDGRSLASRRRPIEEAGRLADTVDIRKAAVVVVLGFGLGHHVGALARRLGGAGMIVVFEPDLPLLRAVFERIDHSDWLSETKTLLFSDPADGASLSASTEGAEGLLALGARFVEHPPSARRLGESAGIFSETFSKLIAATRTVVVTTMVQSEATVRNLVMNLDHYARRGAGVADLAGLHAARPAIVVSAGPSLHRNIDLLARPGLRDRCVIIAVQTTLKTLLARGVRPHFVTALDYHEISRRFYEGLTPEDVEGVTLIAEPKANPAILDSFPGQVRCPNDQTINMILGEGLSEDHGSIREGATVAHLAYYFARHLGCDPVGFIGQDLGFTDGQYYAAGAAIHDVWAPELNPFNTIEMMEWQRIVRSRHTLRKATDHLGRPVYTDEQMSTYLAQFERDFKRDLDEGRRIYDATEGGVAKAGARSITLADFLERFAGEDAPLLADTPPIEAALSEKRRRRVEDRLLALRRDVVRVGELSLKTERHLKSMLEVQGDQRRTNKLIEEVNANRDQVKALDPAFSLVQRINQTGGFRRVRTDREIKLDGSLDPMQRQRRQIERDSENVRWIADAAESMAELLEAGIRAVRGGAKQTRDPGHPEPEEALGAEAGVAVRKRSTTVGAVIPIPLGGSSLRADLFGRSPLQATLERLSRCKRLDRAILLTDDPDAVRGAIEIERLSIQFEIVRTQGDPLGPRRRPIESALAFAPDCWRGGVGLTAACDALLAAQPTAQALEAFDLDGALLVGADWPLVDPALCDEMIERFEESPEKRRVVFSQAPPGVAGCVVARSLIDEFARAHAREAPFAGIGAALGYIPTRPMADPVAQSVCVQIDPAVRDLAVAPALGSQAQTRMITEALRDAGLEEWERIVDRPVVELARPLTGALHEQVPAGPREALIELAPPIASSGRRAAWWRLDEGSPERAPMSVELFESILRQAREARDDCVISILGPGAGAGEPLDHPDVAEILRRAAAHARAVHLRTDLVGRSDISDLLSDDSVDVLSVDLSAIGPEVYQSINGADRYHEALANVDALLRRRRRVGGLPRPWIVPRLTRCDATYEQIEPFYDRWLMLAGAAAIDQAPRAAPGERIQPLGKPRLARFRDARARMRILSDGSVVADERDVHGRRPVGRLGDEPLRVVWRRLQDLRRASMEDDGDEEWSACWTGW